MKHVLYAVSAGSQPIVGIQSQNIVTGVQTRGEPSDGQVHSRRQSIVGVAPRGTFSTIDIADALAVTGGLGCSVAGLSGFLNLYLQPAIDGGTRSATGPKYTYRKGILVPRRLTVQQDGDATLDLEVIASWDGQNDPIVVTTSVTLPNFAQVDALTLGPAQIAGITLNGLKQLVVDFGISVRTESYNGSIYPRECSIITQMPTISLRGIDPTWFGATVVPLLGLVAPRNNTLLFLRRRYTGGTFYPDASAVHVCLQASAMAVIEGGPNASGEDSAETSITLACYAVGDPTPTLPITPLVNTAITI